jgi:pimeloyl-ACP methyl ester carboxylesterase
VHLSMVVAILIGGVILILLAGWFYQRIGTARDRKRYPAPGEFVDVGSHRLHCLIMGEGSPTVVFESGLMSTVLSWRESQPEIAKTTRTLAYDRSGLGWSDRGPETRDAEQIIRELRELLDRARVPPPYILVGHSFGGLTTRLFAGRYPQEVCGLVLIDPVVPGEWNPASERNQKSVRVGTKILRRTAAISRWGVIRFLAFLMRAGATTLVEPLVRLISKGAPKGDGTTKSPLFWNLPPAERAMAHVFWVQEKFTKTMASQLQNLSRSAAQVASATNLEGIPITVISAANTPAERKAEQVATARLSSRGKHLTAARGGHWVMEDEPAFVLDAIREVIENARHAVAPKPDPVVSHGANEVG